jgi:murein DD-endopeptidase MepM/ murein hydrolase activator NlpD
LTIRFWLLVILLVAIVAGFVFLIPRLEGTPPEIGELAAIELGRAPQTLVVNVSDDDSGLKTVEVRIVSGGDSRTLAERHFPGSFATGGETTHETIEIPLTVEELGLADGAATIVILARDWSLRDGLAGNVAEQNTSLVIDTIPPELTVHSGLTYVNRGGAGAVAYRLNEPAAQDGVRVGDAFFRGHALPSDAQQGAVDPLERIAIFAIPVEASTDPEVRVVAQDSAGNESEAGFPVRTIERQFKQSAITLSSSFLEGKVRPLAEANGLAASDPGESFKQVNETLRARSEDRIRAAVENGSSTRRWHGSFEQMHNSKVTSRFAERRAYWWNDRPISRAVHYGFDLASTRGAAVTAANGGIVVFADDLGIYGNCVIVDHGLGIHSLYGHLSTIEVENGETVNKGQSLGRSGATGLAGGDHLHFAILVGGEYVDPVEWWDPKWVHSHIESRLNPEAAPEG